MFQCRIALRQGMICRKRANKQTVVSKVLRRMWGWTGNTLRKSARNITRQAVTWNPQRKRKRGRPGNTWRWDTDTEVQSSGYICMDIEE